MKVEQVKYVFLLICALSAVLPLAAAETTVSSWSDFRKAVNDSRYDVIKVNNNFSLGRSISITRNLKIKSASSTIRTISNNNSYTFSINSKSL